MRPDFASLTFWSPIFVFYNPSRWKRLCASKSAHGELGNQLTFQRFVEWIKNCEKGMKESKILPTEGLFQKNGFHIYSYSASVVSTYMRAELLHVLAFYRSIFCLHKHTKFALFVLNVKTIEEPLKLPSYLFFIANIKSYAHPRCWKCSSRST